MQFEELDQLYQDIILDHRKNPRNHSLLSERDIHAEGDNPFCGDEIILEAKLGQDTRIIDVGFQGVGCAISQASASMLTEQLRGKSLEEVTTLIKTFREMMHGQELTEDERESLGDLGVLEGVKRFPIRIKCALLAWSTLQDGLKDFKATL